MRRLCTQLSPVARQATLLFMARSENCAEDSGHFVAQHVIPLVMSVMEAAGRLGVGRPALSYLLNGKEALSHNTARRLEATFGVDRRKLLEFRGASDRDRRLVEDRAAAVGAYVRGFLDQQLAAGADGRCKMRYRSSGIRPVHEQRFGMHDVVRLRLEFALEKVVHVEIARQYAAAQEAGSRSAATTRPDGPAC